MYHCVKNRQKAFDLWQRQFDESQWRPGAHSSGEERHLQEQLEESHSLRSVAFTSWSQHQHFCQHQLRAFPVMSRNIYIYDRRSSVIRLLRPTYPTPFKFYIARFHPWLPYFQCFHPWLPYFQWPMCFLPVTMQTWQILPTYHSISDFDLKKSICVFFMVFNLAQFDSDQVIIPLQILNWKKVFVFFYVF